MSAQINLPDALQPLKELAYNLWFSWNPDARDLYRDIDLELWHEVERNPIVFLQHVNTEKLNSALANTDYMKRLNTVYTRFKNYLAQETTLFNSNYPNLTDQTVAYFSAEYGMHESLPNYAGGLGVLSGDHCKTATDIGLPFVAVGLMYKHAYFTQYINEAGDQIEEYKMLNQDELAISLVTDDDGNASLVSVPILDHAVFIKTWKVQVGRITLFLLDTNVDKNSEEDKNIIHSLYGGSRDTRIQQEIILGIGGLRSLRKMGIHPAVFHMNEGHSAFLGLERLYELINDGMDFKPALEFIRSTSLFTTHTPIPAGNESFEFEMMQRYFKDFWPELEMSDDYFFDLGRNMNIHQHENFSLTILALNMSYMANGVSKLHSHVSRSMWQKVFPAIPTEEVPIGYVTNGIHTESWLHREMIKLFDTYLDVDWRNHIHEADYWNKILNIPDDKYWQAMMAMKKAMVRRLKRHYTVQLKRYQGDHGFPPVEDVFDENMLTIGFARRFAPYKRATLLFSDRERIRKILNNSDRPVQILFSGKAHPQNDAGKELIRAINEIARDDGFRGKVTFVENYGINISRAMVSGVDVWLNNPRRPLEASGTSGQKVPINGGINFSVLDGWWPEGYNGKNGWTIGREVEYSDHHKQDHDDSMHMYKTLENDIVPLFYDRDKNGIPLGWVRKSKESLRSNLTKFSTHTMLWNYIQKFYVPGMRRSIKYQENENAALFRFTRWRNRVIRHWKNVTLHVNGDGQLSEDTRIFGPGESKEISINVSTGSLKPKELRVELILERQDAIKLHQHMEIYPMGLIGEAGENVFEYRSRVKAKRDGTYRYNCRVVPTHPDMFSQHETRLIKWLD